MSNQVHLKLHLDTVLPSVYSSVFVSSEFSCTSAVKLSVSPDVGWLSGWFLVSAVASDKVVCHRFLLEKLFSSCHA